MGEPIRVTVPFGEFLPDLGELDNPGLLEASGVIPAGGDDYHPISTRWNVASPTQRPLGMVYTSTVSGIATHLIPWNMYYGGNNGASSRIYVLDPSTDPWTETDVAGVNLDPSTDWWYFTSFGDQDIVCCGNALPVKARTGGAGNFADLITSTQKPRFKLIEPIGTRLMGAVVTATGVTIPDAVGPNILWFSGTDAANSFGIPSTHPGQRTNYFKIGDETPITALTGGSFEEGLVFKENEIYRVEISITGDQFYRLASGIGTRFPLSVVRVERDVYFWSASGPQVVRAGARVEPLGLGKITRASTDTNWLDLNPLMAVSNQDEEWQLTGAYDPVTDSVLWTYQVRETDPTSVVMLAYHRASNRWSATRISGGVPSPAVDNWAVVRIPYDGYRYSAPRSVVLVRTVTGSGSSQVDWFSDGIPDEYPTASFEEKPTAVLSSAFVSLDGRGPFVLQRVRPRFSKTASAASDPRLDITVTMRTVPWGSNTSTTFTNILSSIDGDGWIPLPGLTQGNLVRVQFSWTDPGSPPDKVVAEHGSGFDMEVMPMGVQAASGKLS